MLHHLAAWVEGTALRCYRDITVKIPDFEPAIARVLEAAGRIQMRMPEGAVDVNALTRHFQADDDPLGAELSKDPDRVRSALEQLRSDGLLEAVPGGSGYRLTPLGEARVSRRREED